jgi:L-rhamnose mutarotase
MVTIQDNGLQVGHKTTQEMHIALISTQDQPILLSACDENVEFAERDIEMANAHTSAYAELEALITSTGVLTYVIAVKDIHTCPTIALETGVHFASDITLHRDVHTSAYAELAALITSTGALTYVIVVKDVHTCPTIALKTGVNFAMHETTVPPCARESAIATLGAFITSMPVPTCVVAVKHRHIQL